MRLKDKYGVKTTYLSWFGGDVKFRPQHSRTVRKEDVLAWIALFRKYCCRGCSAVRRFFTRNFPRSHFGEEKISVRAKLRKGLTSTHLSLLKEQRELAKMQQMVLEKEYVMFDKITELVELLLEQTRHRPQCEYTTKLADSFDCFLLREDSKIAA